MSDDPFVSHRGLVFTVAYEMLGSAADAEDVVQEAWLRWADVDRAGVRDPRAYLVRIVTRQALNRLRTVARRREEYVGPWLPEPLLTSPDVAEDVGLAESVSIAMLTVLETLGPVERAVFVLREVFDTPYDEIAAALDKSASAVRQIAHRAREYVAARGPRMEVSTTEQQAVVERFLATIRTGDVQGLLDVLAPDVVAVADGGGLAAAARHPVAGADRVARLLARLATVAPGAHGQTTWFNGAPAVRLDLDGQLHAAISLVIHDGRVTRIYAIGNPQKLAGLDEPAPSRGETTADMAAFLLGVVAGLGIAIPVGAIAVLIVQVEIRCGFWCGTSAGAGALLLTLRTRCRRSRVALLWLHPWKPSAMRATAQSTTVRSPSQPPATSGYAGKGDDELTAGALTLGSTEPLEDEDVDNLRIGR